MWKQWRVKGGKEPGKENSNDKKEASLAKIDDKTKGNWKKKGDKDPNKKETRTCNYCQEKGHIEANFWQKYLSKMSKQEQYWTKKDAKTEKATAADEEEHLLSVVDVEVEGKYEFNNDAVGFLCLDMNDTFIEVQVIENNAFVQIELGLEEEDVKNEDELDDVSQIRSTLQALSSPNMWIYEMATTIHTTKHRQGGINSRPSTRRTRGIYLQAVKPNVEVDFPGIFCDKNGKEQFAVKLRNASHFGKSLQSRQHHTIDGRRSFGEGKQERWDHSSERWTSHQVQY